MLNTSYMQDTLIMWGQHPRPELQCLQLAAFVPDIHHHSGIHPSANVTPFPHGRCFWLHGGWGKEGKSAALTFAAGP